MSFILGMSHAKSKTLSTLSEELAGIAEKFGNPSMQSIKKLDYSICVFFEDAEAIGYTTDDRIIPLTLDMSNPVCIEN